MRSGITVNKPLSRDSAANSAIAISASDLVRGRLSSSGIQARSGKSRHSASSQNLFKAVIKALVLIFTAIMMIPPMTVTTARADSSLEKMRAAAEKITSVQGDFVQEKHMPILAKPLVSHGYFAYQRPTSLRWEYRKPLKSILLLHDGNVNRYLHTAKGWEKDTTANPQSMDFILQEISNWLNGRFEGNPLFHAAVGKDKKVVLTPKDKGMDQFIRRIELVMADQPGVIEQVTIYEGEDSFTRFTFVDPRINDAIPPSQFRKIQ
jgi:outer membrane lipoprotein-sorting protein